MAINAFFAALQANAKLADALGADWGQLMGGGEGATGRRTAEEGGETRRRWTAPEIIRRIGISRQGQTNGPFFLQNLKLYRTVTYEQSCGSGSFQCVSGSSFIQIMRIWIPDPANGDSNPANLRPLV
jgi:hypothetical protein